MLVQTARGDGHLVSLATTKGVESVSPRLHLLLLHCTKKKKEKHLYFIEGVFREYLIYKFFQLLTNYTYIYQTHSHATIPIIC